jgi:predicted PurR-regulated permease PerM
VESLENPVITPCECSGSMKYIHEDCLKTWILSQSKEPKLFCCDICKYAIKMEIKLEKIFSRSNVKKELFKMVLLPFIICIVTTILAFICFTLFSQSNSSVSTPGKIYLSAVVVVCVFIIAVLSTVFIRSIKTGCFELQIIHWKILSNVKQAEQDSITHLTEHFDKKPEKITSKIEKYVINLDDTQFMVKNLEARSAESEEEENRDHNSIFLNELPGTPRLPNEVENP